jgi:hypothetical protein
MLDLNYFFLQKFVFLLLAVFLVRKNNANIDICYACFYYVKTQLLAIKYANFCKKK